MVGLERAVSALIPLNATFGLRSRLAAAVAATDSSRVNSSTTRTLFSADALAATCGLQSTRYAFSPTISGASGAP